MAMYLRVSDLLDRAEKDESVVVVVLTGAGEYFTSGADMKELEALGVRESPSCAGHQHSFRLSPTASCKGDFENPEDYCMTAVKMSHTVTCNMYHVTCSMYHVAASRDLLV